MSGLTEFVGYGGWVLLLLFIGWLGGWAHVGLVDSKRRYEQDLADDAAREAKLAEGRATQIERGDFAEVTS